MYKLKLPCSKIAIIDKEDFKLVQQYTSWHSTGASNSVEKYLGSYKTNKEAALAYNNAAKIYFGKFASLNNLEV